MLQQGRALPVTARHKPWLMGLPAPLGVDVVTSADGVCWLVEMVPTAPEELSAESPDSACRFGF